MYLVLDLLTGGDLRYQIGHHRKRYFSEQQTKFFISCIIESLIYIHSKNIIHRDIKPENLVFDSKGYLHTTDFGIAKFMSKKNRNETSGTPGYMAPEVMKGLDHTKSVDFFAVGVITYELMMGKRPYIGKNRKEIKEQMMSKQIYIDKEMLPFNWSEESADFINGLLIRKDVKRLGYYNDLEIKNHPWFNDINFDELVKKNIEAPFLPKINHDNYDKKYCGEIEKIGFDTNYRYEEYKANENYSDLFYGFTFYNVDESQLQIYKKPNVRYVQNQKSSILRNKNARESKTLDLDNIEHLSKLLNDIKLIQKINTIDVEKDIKNKDSNTLDIEDNNNNKVLNNNENAIDKNINIFFDSNDTKREKNKKSNISNVHKRMSSNLIGHNYLYFLQKKKLFNSHKKANSFQNISINNSNTINNNSNSQNKNSIKQKINHNSTNYQKIRKKYEKKIIHDHSNSYGNNLYANLISKIKKESEILRNMNLIERINMNNQYKKKSIEIDHISRFINIKNNYQSVKNIKNKSDIYSSIDNNDSISSIKCKNDMNQKLDMMKASTNFYSRQEIPYNKLNRITPINLRNKNISFNLNSKFSNDSNNILDSINIDKTIINPRRPRIKVKTRSFSRKPLLDYSNSNTNQKIINMISSEEHSLENKKKLFNTNIKVSKVLPMTHNYSYSSFNNRNKIDSLIRSLIESDKPKKNTIPIDIKKTSNTIKNSKVSTLHKKIPIPSSFGQKIFHKRLNGYIVKKLKNITNNSYSSSNNNSINNSSLSKNYNNIFNNTKSSSISKIMKKEIKFNNINPNIIFPNTTINVNKKKNYKLNLNKKSNDFNSLIKKLNDFSKNHKKNMSFGSNISYCSLNVGNKENKSKKFKIKSNFIKTQIKKIGDKKLKIGIGSNEELTNIGKKDKEKNEIKDDFCNVLNNNLNINKKFTNYNRKNKYNLNNKILKSNNGNSYPSCNSTTSSGNKININNK